MKEKGCLKCNKKKIEEKDNKKRQKRTNIEIM